MLTIREAPRTVALTTIERVKAELALTDQDAARDARLETLILEATDAVATFCDRGFARAAVTELVPGGGRHLITVSLTPVLEVSAVRYQEAPVALEAIRITAPVPGFVYNETVWTVTHTIPFDVLAPDYAVEYIGGYLMPGDDLTASGTLAAASGVNTFTLAGETFPILVSGEVITVAGFANAVNNGRHRVLARTPTVVQVATALVDETPVGVTTIALRTLPRDLERACVETVRAWYWGARDPMVKSESLGDWATTYADADPEAYGLPPVVAGGLARWARPALA